MGERAAPMAGSLAVRLLHGCHEADVAELFYKVDTDSSGGAWRVWL